MTRAVDERRVDALERDERRIEALERVAVVAEKARRVLYGLGGVWLARELQDALADLRKTEVPAA